MPNAPLILIVDDVPENIEVLGDALADLGKIIFALSGEEALSLVDQMRPDLILLDIMMPGIDGYEVCKRLKGRPPTRDVPVIFVTAKSDAASETQGLKVGAIDFIQKPVNRDVVRARVQLQLKLIARERELQHHQEELEQRVRERTQALSDALALAERANRAKSAFLATMSHELRTPMNAILGLAFIVGQKLTDPGLRDKMNKIRAAGESLIFLINDILEISRLEADKVQIEHIDFALPSVFAVTEEAWRERAAAKGLTFVSKIDPALPRALRGDPTRLGQILSNLLSNAVKFSERGAITLRARLFAAQGDTLQVRFEVADQGIGIGEENKESIFASFVQADSASTRKHGGSGLGLAICKQLASLMGGEIGVISSPGQGSTFWIRIPLERGAREERPGTTSVTEIDWQQAREVVGYLARLLAEDDFQAQTLWQANAALLDHILGEQAPAFNEAMENFDLGVAHALLGAAMLHCPQLAN